MLQTALSFRQLNIKEEFNTFIFKKLSIRKKDYTNKLTEFIINTNSDISNVLYPSFPKEKWVPVSQ